MALTRRDWLILLLAYRGVESPDLDPVRIQKGMFLAAQTGATPAAESYQFQPYNYGPYSSDLRVDTQRLVAEGLAVGVPVPGYTWRRYQLTDAGIEYARGLLQRAPIQAQRALFDIKQRITSLSFNDLLREVYADYPDYATASVFNG